MKGDMMGLETELYELRAQLDAGNIDLRLYHCMLREIEKEQYRKKVFFSEKEASYYCNRKKYMI